MGTAHTSSQMKSTHVDSFRKKPKNKVQKPEYFHFTFTVNQENLPYFLVWSSLVNRKGFFQGQRQWIQASTFSLFCLEGVMSAWPTNHEHFQINIRLMYNIDSIVLSVMGLTCSFSFPSLPLSSLMLTALANKITWWIFHDNMGSGTSTTEDEGHLDDTHEESKSLFSFQHVTCCFPFF